jgi:hypothetical protein
MLKNTLKTGMVLVGFNLILVLALYVVESTIGISDMDPTMLLVMAVMGLEYPAITLANSIDINPFRLESAGFIDTAVFMLLVALQWTIISSLLSGCYKVFRVFLSGDSAHNSDAPHQDA